MKLELKHLCSYLPYGLMLSAEYMWPGCKIPLVVANYSSDMRNGINATEAIERGAKPILRPLSDLTKEIEHNGERFVPVIEWGWVEDINRFNHNYFKYRFESYWKFEQLINHHFDVFGLIEKGLAIDINTLEK